jgi:hypothetical protein
VLRWDPAAPNEGEGDEALINLKEGWSRGGAHRRLASLHIQFPIKFTPSDLRFKIWEFLD